MLLAREYLESAGWSDVVDVSSKQPFDYLCTKGGIPFSVEVKGTVSSGEKIILTQGEVNHHRKVYPNNALVVVSGITLEGDGNDEAMGGAVSLLSPWAIDDLRLQPVSYFYDVYPDH